MGLMSQEVTKDEELIADTPDDLTLSGGLPKAAAPYEGDRAALDAAVIEMRRKEADGPNPTFYDKDDQDFAEYGGTEEPVVATPSVAIAETEEMLTGASGDTVADEVTSAVYETVQQEENGIRDGWSNTSSKWLPHASKEGGTPTIAYGHKFATQAEADAVTASGGITEAKAIELFKEDMSTAESRAKSQYEAAYADKSWDTLDVLGKLMLTEVVFNIGTLKDKEGKYGWPSLTTAIHDKDFAMAKDQLSRTYTKPDGTVESLDNRTTALQGVYEKVLPLTDWVKEDLTNWGEAIR